MFLINKEIRNGAVAKPYMRRPLIIYEFARAPFRISLYMREKFFFYQFKCFYKVFVFIRIALGCIPKTEIQLAAKWR